MPKRRRQRLASESVEIVLSPDYKPASPLAEAAANRSLDELAPENPVAAELSAIREALEEVRKTVKPRSFTPVPIHAQIDSMRSLIESLVRQGVVSDVELESLINDSTPQSFNDWAEARIYEVRALAKSSGPPNSGSRPVSSKGGQFNDEPPTY